MRSIQAPCSLCNRSFVAVTNSARLPAPSANRSLTRRHRYRHGTPFGFRMTISVMPHLLVEAVFDVPWLRERKRRSAGIVAARNRIGQRRKPGTLRPLGRDVAFRYEGVSGRGAGVITQPSGEAKTLGFYRLRRRPRANPPRLALHRQDFASEDRCHRPERPRLCLIFEPPVTWLAAAPRMAAIRHVRMQRRSTAETRFEVRARFAQPRYSFQASSIFRASPVHP
jgi:hypothetical protein